MKPFGQKDNGGDLVETAFLIQGLLAVHQYYVNGNEKEKALAQRIDQIWRDVDWNWYRQGGQNVLYWHWSPTYGWEMNFPVHGYNECMIMYILAAASPTMEYLRLSIMTVGHRTEPSFLRIKWKESSCTSAIRHRSRTAFLGSILFPRT